MTTKIASIVMLILFAGTVGVVAYLVLGGEIGPTPEIPTPTGELAMAASPTSTDAPTPVPDDTVTPTISATSSPTALPTHTPTPSKTTTPTSTPPDTPTLTPVATDTPVPATHTSTPKSTDTPRPPTATPTTTSPTSTPIPPTKTPTLSPTSTPIPATATPEPVAESGLGPTWGAVVDVPGGLVTIRSGPGDEYDKIHDLPDGTLLEVMRTVHNKPDWIKVVVNPDTEEPIKGYVNIASGLVKLNTPLENVPPIYEFGPKLHEPKPGAVYSPEDVTWWFSWETFDLKPAQYYSFRLVLDVEPEATPCIHTQVKDPEVYLNPDDQDCPRGAYYWTVVLATDLSGGHKSEWREDSEFSLKNHFGIGMPHPNVPSADGGDDGTGSLPPPP